MLKKLTVAITLSFALALGGFSARAAGFKDLSFEGSYVARHPTVLNVWQPFFKEVEKKFPGKNGLSFHYFSNQELYPESEGIAAMNDGRVDFGTVRPSLFPGQMNLLGVVAIPGMCQDAIVGSLVTQDLIDKFPEVRAELPRGGLPYVGWASAAYQFHTRTPVEKPSDLKGMKIIVWDATTLEMAKAMGASPIRLPAPDSYLSLSRGMADGVLCPLAPVRSYKITEICKHHYILSMSVNTFVMNVNKNLWESMPEDMRDWLKAEGGAKMAMAIGKSLEDGVIRDMKWMKEEDGHQFVIPSATERAEALKPLDSFVDAWKAECKGADPVLLGNVLKYARERSKFHADKVNSGAYGEAYKK